MQKIPAGGGRNFLYQTAAAVQNSSWLSVQRVQVVQAKTNQRSEKISSTRQLY